jgi:hypothetical protein
MPDAVFCAAIKWWASDAAAAENQIAGMMGEGASL